MITAYSALVSVFACLPLFARPESPDRPPNFIIILCDNLGYGDTSPFGSKLHRTPQLDRMAREGMRFTHFYATAGVCTPSRASFLTGCYAQRVGLGRTDPDGIVLRPVSPNGLHPEEITLAEVLKKRGYATALLGKWHLGDQLPFLPTRQGFDFYFGIPYSDDMTADKRPDGQWPPLPLMENDMVVEAPADRNLLTKRYTERALKFIEAHRNRPFFLFLSHAMPGSTRAPFASGAFRGMSKNGPWGDSVEEIDWSTGEILGKLRELGLENHTLVLWTSDNGAPGAANQADPSRGSNHPLFGRGYTTAEGAFRVPAIFWWPGKIPAGRACEELATSMDLFPTLTQLSGGELPRDRIIDGKEIEFLLFGDPGARTPHDVLYYYFGNQLQAVRSGPWKLFLPLENPERHPHHRGKGPSPAFLFNVVNDIGYKQNLAHQHAEVVQRLTGLAEKGREELGDTGRRGKGQRPVGRFEDPTPRVLKKSSGN